MARDCWDVILFSLHVIISNNDAEVARELMLLLYEIVEIVFVRFVERRV